MEMTDRNPLCSAGYRRTSPNVVQDHAAVLYLVRSRTNAGVRELYERVCDVARGAALMTDTTVEIEFDKACSNVVPNEVLGRLAYETMVRLGPPSYTKEEETYVKAYHALCGKEAVLMTMEPCRRTIWNCGGSWCGNIPWLILSCRISCFPPREPVLRIWEM